ncbi:adenylosuccinate lyase [mine drainage metagenome]|uniref:Adenylosuccinate lyase n=1 Tax=mine drainage metagenome TaxID=410659 RepID=T1BVN5_9ZZZZ
MLEAELAISTAQEEFKLIPQGSSEKLKIAISVGIKPKRVKEIESEIRHDIMALIKAISENGEELNYLHFGITSNDINDTATALQLKEFLVFLMDDLYLLQKAFISLIKKYKNSPMLGRTHGQHASPITFGLKMSAYLSEVNRHIERIGQAMPRILVGKALGPVGTGASMGKLGLSVSKKAMEILGLNSEIATGQIVARDRYVEFLSILSGISASLEKFTTEVRNLQRPEIDEVMENFDSKNQVGSSSMPSKRNPIDSENVCSLSRIIRAMVTPEIEGSITWHERDLTNSALERFTIPYSCILIDHILLKSANIFQYLYVNEKRMLENLVNSQFTISERIVTQLTLKGLNRQESHELVRKASMNSYNEQKGFKQALIEQKIEKYIDEKELDILLLSYTFVGAAEEICEQIVTESEKLMII